MEVVSKNNIMAELFSLKDASLNHSSRELLDCSACSSSACVVRLPVIKFRKSKT